MAPERSIDWPSARSTPRGCPGGCDLIGQLANLDPLEDFLYRAKPWAITLISHNWPIMLLLGLVLWTAHRAYIRPSRPALLRLYGCLLVALTFEYQKHGVQEALITTDYLFSQYANPGLRWLSQVALGDLLPWILYLAGAAILVLGLVRTMTDRDVSAGPATGDDGRQLGSRER